MGEFKTRWKAPQPDFFNKVIRLCMLASAAAFAILGAEALGKTMLPHFTFTLLPWANVLLKNIFVAGLAAAAVAKLTKKPEGSSQVDAPGNPGPGGSQNPPPTGLPPKP